MLVKKGSPQESKNNFFVKCTYSFLWPLYYLYHFACYWRILLKQISYKTAGVTNVHLSNMKKNFWRYQQLTLLLGRTFCQSFKFINSLEVKKLDNCNFDPKFWSKILTGSLYYILVHIQNNNFFDKFHAYAPKTSKCFHFQNIVNAEFIMR